MDFAKKTSRHFPGGNACSVDTRTPSSITASQTFSSCGSCSPPIVDLFSPRSEDWQGGSLEKSGVNSRYGAYFGPTGSRSTESILDSPHAVRRRICSTESMAINFEPMHVRLSSGADRIPSSMQTDLRADSVSLERCLNLSYQAPCIPDGGRTWLHAKSWSPKRNETPYTTLVLQNLPHKCTRDMLVQEIHDRGFLHCMDFFHLPINIRRKQSAGYCFVNMTAPEAAYQFRKAFHGIVLHGVENSTICSVAVGNVQGLHACIKMSEHSQVANMGEGYQPQTFANQSYSEAQQEYYAARQGIRGSRTPVCSEYSIFDGVDAGSVETTTLMLRGIPNRYTKHMLINKFAERGVLMDIDFLYLPIDLRHKCNVGYCFLNLTSKDAVIRFFDTFKGLALCPVRSRKTCEISIGRVQGQQANVDLYRNTSVMMMDDECRPVIFKEGRLIPFPGPTISKEEVLLNASRRTGVSNRAERSSVRNKLSLFQCLT